MWRMKTVGDGRGKWSFRGGWRRPWLDGGDRSGRRLPRRMQAAVADGTTPSADGGGDSGRASAVDGVAHGGQRQPRWGGSGGRRLQWRTVADGGG